MIISTLILTFCDPLSVWTAPCEDMGHHEPEHPPCDRDRRLRQGCQLSLLLQAGKKIMNIEYKPISNAVHRHPCGSRDIWIFQWYLKSYWYLRSISTFDTILYIRFTDLVCSVMIYMCQAFHFITASSFHMKKCSWLHSDK